MNKHLNEDLTDSAADQEKLKPDEAIFNLPELKDIPEPCDQEKIQISFLDIILFLLLTRKPMNYWKKPMASMRVMSPRWKKSC